MRFLSTLVLAVSALYASAAPAYDLANTTTTTLAERDLLERAPGVITTCKNRGEFALTFDDGPYWGNKPAKTLSDNGGRGTFFLNGNNWGCIYDRADQIIAAYKAGHTIGSHTWSHPDIAKLSEAQLHKQLDLVEGAFKKILGIKPRLFRPPYGSYNDRALRVLQQRGYTVVNWNFDSGDTAGKSASQIISAYNKVAYPNPYIALNHETKSVTVDQVIPKVVPMLKAKGYKLVTVDKCLGISPYQSVGAAGKRDKTWTCSGTLAPGQA